MVIAISVSYDEGYTENDAKVAIQRLAPPAVLEAESRYLKAQRKGDVPARIPSPCGCGGSGS